MKTNAMLRTDFESSIQLTLDEGVSGPSVDSKVAVTIGLVGTGVGDDSKSMLDG